MRERLENISLTTVGYFLNSTSVTRHYLHDCQHCKHLGTLTMLSRDPHVYDVYIHGHTIIFRDSNSLHEYWSMDMRGDVVGNIFSDNLLRKIAFVIYLAIKSDVNKFNM